MSNKANSDDKGLTLTQNLMNNFTAKGLKETLSLLNSKSPDAVHSLIERCLHQHKVKLFFSFLVNDTQLLRMIPSDLRWLKESQNAKKLKLIKKATDAMLEGLKADSNTTLACIATIRGELLQLKFLHELGADLTEIDSEGYTFAHLAACDGHKEVLAYLLKNKPELVNAETIDGITPAYSAADRGKLSSLELLHQYRADLVKVDDNGITLAHVAVKNGHRNVLEFLLKSKPELRDKQTSDGVTLAYCAVETGQLDILELLYKLGADLAQADINGITPAHIAALRGYTDVLKFLLSNKPELRDKQMNNGVTPAYCAADTGKLSILKLLDEFSADLAKANENLLRPTHIAAQNRHRDVLEFLLEKNPESVNERTSYGATAAFIAAQNGDAEALSLLISYKANLDLTYHVTIGSFTKFGEGLDLTIQENINQHISKQDNNTNQDNNTLVALSPLDIAQIMGYKKIIDIIKNNPSSNPANSMYTLFGSVQKESAENLAQVSKAPEKLAGFKGG
ncbi:ankyrin repeat protein [Legionella massiliensis]|uniref:Ankyrin repeat protein n=2 Tax=Legionella massiliensis TaxID=1034943 RepID=A0A078L6H5_9GAMM|nr:ankyrin repeat protein [Legionella massiliensis]CEE15246.1 Ankyrin repeats (3 copies) [Legionella massiliensis]